METKEASTCTTDPVGSENPTTGTPIETKGKLHLDIPDDDKSKNPTQEITSGEKTAVESSKDDAPKTESAEEKTEFAEEKDWDTYKWHWEENRKKVPRKAAVKWSDYEHFKNRYSPEEGLEIIEVLYGHPELGSEIAEEKARRTSKTTFVGRKAASMDSRWIQRVRIESPVLIPLLAHLTSYEGASNDWSSDRPRVFFRPFTTFYHTLPLMNKCVEILENGGDVVPDPVLTPNFPGDVPIIDSFSGTNIQITLFALDPDVALPQMRVYVEFVEKNIVPMWAEAAGTSKQRARWCDLPMFFRPGELLYANHEADSRTPEVQPAVLVKSDQKLAIQQLWKFISLYVSGLDENGPCDWRKGNGMLTIRAYHIDFDGDRYGPSESEASIPEYSGEREIRSLLYHPLRYEKERKKMESDLCKRGQRFLPLVRERHCYYDGWSILYGKIDEDFINQSHRENPEYIDGEIMIDFKEGGRFDRDLVGYICGSYDWERSGWCDEADYVVEIMFWDDPTRLKLLGESTDIAQGDEDFCKRYELSALKHDRFLRDHNDDEEQYVLLPQRLVAYSFRSRKFFMADIHRVSPVVSTKHSFRDLKINPDHKRMVKSLALSHFEKQEMKRHTDSANMDQDFIRGKGAGLIILLHGVPGVGKTTTAEAVALHSRKPLFTITSADLGFTPFEVESKLIEFFRLAQIWDCVLLLDEADLFLSRREIEDLERNALVSATVFLRVLEYYNGILFLTTNRVGTMDEAFKSRIHISLYYPPLTEEQTIDIFHVNLGRLHEIEASKTASRPGHTAVEIDNASILNFARGHFRKHPQSERWNGRQIRNAFQVAYSLAQFATWDKDPDDSDDDESMPQGTLTNGEKASASRGPLKMDSSHFKIVEKSIERFDHYLFKTRGADADTAKTHQLRNDRYREPREREDEWGSLGPDYRGGQRPNVRRDMPRSPGGRGSMFDAVVRSPRNPPRDHFGDEDEEELEEEANSELAGPDYGRFKKTAVRQSFPTSHSSPSVPRARRGGDDRHYGPRGGDEYSPDEGGYGRGGSMSSGRANSYGRDRDAYEY
ncbi:hypothetical protein DHEL01_v210757 [Diaporthe helianthi]|uniref:AAA+ ATPase domain-containing protein n=1 Tax=Diaporthe helianthi TaxID=158607 RepID=A0A2P5HKU7_DIAHE|nr:hypothetical protein DHEL01_v210757 [Diaporthe helianthi]